MKRIFVVLVILASAMLSYSQKFNDLKNMQKFEGFFDFYYNHSKGQICLVVERLDKEFLYVHSLSSGLGHNDIGLDRGQLGGEAVVYFTRTGNKILLVQPNLRFRAQSDSELEKKAVEQAFARSVLHGFEILDHENGKFLIDLKGMLYSDTHQVIERLAAMKQGNFNLDPMRSAVELPRTKAFPENVEFDVLLTYAGKPEGRLIREVAPDPHSITLNQHHSFVQLPDAGYKPRAFHPGSGCIPVSYMDYASPVYEPIKKQFIIRHRLEKEKPIIYYLDNGTPEPVRSALLEGGSWWNEAFEAIGLQNAFRVEILPEGADPMDVRYNMIQWVHRSTRGWSYGGSVIDPRTGEIIKGHVSLGSLRIRQDFMIAQALVNSPYASDDENHGAMMELALARIRQLSAHEIGHTLGFTHNFAASSKHRSSVMDYPHPLLYVDQGEVKFDSAYTVGIGAWDKVTVAYAYSFFPENEHEGLKKILNGARKQELSFIADSDARAAGGAHPSAHLWDNGASAVEELNKVLTIREVAIQNFGVDNIRTGEPLSLLEDIFVPLYFFHRYQVEAVAKSIGGVDYSYSVKGDGSSAPEAVKASLQREALDALLYTISPQVLMIPEDKLGLFPPRAYGYARTRESFEGQTGITFDYLAPPAAAANFTLEFLLNPERANRLVLQKTLDEKQVSLDELLEILVERTIHSIPSSKGYIQEVMHTVGFLVIDHMIRLSTGTETSPLVKAQVSHHLKTLTAWLENPETKGPGVIYREAYVEQIKKGKVKHLDYLPDLPPGSPIGMECFGH
jgi:hypothetical protein